MHTVAHVHEMKAEIEDGLEFMQRLENHWQVQVVSLGHLPGSFHPIPSSSVEDLWTEVTGCNSVLGKLLLWKVFLSHHSVPWEPHSSQHLPMFAGDPSIGLGLKHLV